MTTIDFIEKSKDNLNSFNNLYDNGTSNNISSVMGSCLLMFLPIAHNGMNNGYSFDINEESFKKLQLQRILEKDEIKSKNMSSAKNNIPRNKI
jgi:hypothetical protein